MRSLFLALPLIAALTGTALAADAPPPPVGAEKLFIVVTSADPQVQGMAMILGLQARKHNTEVRLLLCGPGGDMALKDQPQTPLKPMNKTPQQLLQGLMAQGAKAEVCGLYLPNSDHTAEALIEGVSPVKPPVIGDYMAQPSLRTFTF
jgi:predicted peroxiredoxin